jgi:hypothetical protein
MKIPLLQVSENQNVNEPPDSGTFFRLKRTETIKTSKK